MENCVLCLNGGSSSLKFAVYELSAGGEKQLFAGAAEGIRAADGRFWLRAGGTVVRDAPNRFPDHGAAIQPVFAALSDQGLTRPVAVGHRIVHGGPEFQAPRRVDPVLVAKLEELVPFAPLHLPQQIALIHAVARQSPELPQVACFDTAFHCRMPEVARRFALPRELWEKGVRRYGFHGLSYEYLAGRLGRELGRRAILAHLGNGASLVALQDGAPMDTSMGLTPTGGFMMGTRCGDLDPGVLLFLLRKGWTAEQLADLCDRESGLLGVSGLSSEMKTLLEVRSQEANAAQAVDMYCYQIRKFIGAYAAVLNGLDMLVFTGGIGERAAEIRAGICRDLEFLGIQLDSAANSAHAEIISSANSRCSVRVVRTDEDLMIVRHTRKLAGV